MGGDAQCALKRRSTSPGLTRDQDEGERARALNQCFQGLTAGIPGDRNSQAADFGAMRRRAGSLTRSPARAAARGFRLV